MMLYINAARVGLAPDFSMLQSTDQVSMFFKVLLFVNLFCQKGQFLTHNKASKTSIIKAQRC
jgi:hypothetical protein